MGLLASVTRVARRRRPRVAAQGLGAAAPAVKVVSAVLPVVVRLPVVVMVVVIMAVAVVAAEVT